jgi:hypothetical protein
MALRSSSSASATSGNITATPSGVQVGDYLGGLFSLDDSAGEGTITNPTSWTTRATETHPLSTPDGHVARYADKVATGSDSFTWQATSGGPRSCVNAAWSDRNQVNPRSTNPVTTLNTTSNTSPVSATLNGITAVNEDDIGIFWWTDQTAADGRWTSSTITDYTERVDGIALDWVSGIGLQTRDNVSAGGTGNFSVTLTRTAGTGNAGYGAVVVALKCSSAAAGTHKSTTILPPMLLMDDDDGDKFNELDIRDWWG